MRFLKTTLLLFLLTSLSMASISVRNISEWSVTARSPPLIKVQGRDLGNPLYGVKLARAWWAVESGLNVTYVEVTVPRCHRAVFTPVVNLTVGEAVSARLEVISLTGVYASQLSLNISLSGVRQVSIRLGTITQPSGSPVPVSGVSSFALEVIVAGGAPLGVEVARLETWLRYNVSRVTVSQKVTWIFRTFASPPRVVLFYDGFESGNLEGWTRTTYTYVERKLTDVSVTENCPTSAQPRTVTDTTRPVSGEWLAWIGFRNQPGLPNGCEPTAALDDYLRRSVSVPASVDGVEVRFVNVTFWWRFWSWDSANFDYINLRLGVGTANYFFKQNYNPNPGASYGTLRETGWQRNSTIFGGLGGRTATIEFLLHTYSDNLYRSWLYVDEVYFTILFDCASTYVPLAASSISVNQALATSAAIAEVTHEAGSRPCRDCTAARLGSAERG